MKNIQYKTTKEFSEEELKKYYENNNAFFANIYSA